MIEFRVPTIPVAQPRQRHRIIAAGGRQFVNNYTPAKAPINAFKAAVQLAASLVYQGPPLDCPISLVAVFTMPRPKSKTTKRGPNVAYPHTGRPDIDNLYKGLADSLSGLCWRDDAQVAMVTITKRVASGDEQPHVFVSIQPLGETA